MMEWEMEAALELTNEEGQGPLWREVGAAYEFGDDNLMS